MASEALLKSLHHPLTFYQVYFPHTGQRVGNWTVLGHQIADLQVRDAPPPPPVHAQYNQSQPPSHRPSIVSTLHTEPSQPVPSPQPPADDFQDPAILSFARKQGQTTAFPQPQEAPSTPVKVTAPSIVESLQKPLTSPYIGTSSETGKRKNIPRKKGKDAAATLKAPFSNLDINSAAEQEHLDESDEPTVRDENVRRISVTKTRTGKPMDDAPHLGEPKKKSRRKKNTGVRTELDQNNGEGESSPEVVRKANANGTFRGKGWRQTPILQEPATTASPRKPNATQPMATPSGKLSRRQRMELEAQNGWATEDATDIQELPEFDFAENHAKFDKRSVFDQIRTEDTTADEDRLVSFNRTPARPGTYGGKNLHPTENVLDSPNVGPRRTSTVQNSDSDETFDFDSSRAAKKTASRTSSKRPPFRSSSGIADDSASLKELPRALRSLRGGHGGSLSHGTTSSPNPTRFTPPESPSTSQTMPSAHFCIATNNRACPTIMPAGMAAIEEVAESEFGLSADMITESAGRGIAEVAMATLGTAGGKRATRENLRADMRPWAVIFAGNHRAGARALAAARHLRGRNIRTLTCIVGFERQNIELVPEVRRQAEILVRMGAIVRGWPDVKNYVKSEGQPDLVIDALLAPGKTYDGLGSEDQRAVLECVAWCNRGGGAKAVTLSIDMPSGLNGSTGMSGLVSSSSTLSLPFLGSLLRRNHCQLLLYHSPLTSTTGETSIVDAAGADVLQIRADHVICIGAPRIGLLRALQRASVLINSVQHATAQVAEEMLHAQTWVVDVGVNRAWKQSGMASSKGVRFGSDWVVPLKLVEGVAEA
jgi:enhancer of mRNA-decapping protein 3